MDISICEADAIFIKEVMCMTNYREILRLDSIGLNRTEIAASCGCSSTKSRNKGRSHTDFQPHPNYEIASPH